jgi:uncharacterized membrane protein
MQDDKPYSFIQICTIKILTVTITLTQKFTEKLLNRFDKILNPIKPISSTVDKSKKHIVSYFVSWRDIKWKQ